MQTENNTTAGLKKVNFSTSIKASKKYNYLKMPAAFYCLALQFFYFYDNL